MNGVLLKWITICLHGRSQCVVVENRYSSWSKVMSGVPQGSVLGPMLFFLFINDICNISVNGVITKMYADDLKLYTSLLSTDDSHNLQNVLSHLREWSKDWQLEVNVMLVNLTYFIYIKIIHSWITILMTISLIRVTWLLILVLTST